VPRLRRYSLASILAVASLVCFGLIALVVGIVVWKVVRASEGPALLTAFVVSGGVLAVSLAFGFVAVQRYVRATLAGFAKAADALEREDVAFRLDPGRAAEFAPLATRFNAIQERLEVATASKTRLQDQELEARTAAAELNAKVAASAETLRVVEKAAHAWRQTFDAVDFVLLTIDREGVVQRVNRAAVAMLGGRFDAWIGKPLTELPDSQPWRAIKALIKDVFTDGLPLTSQVEEGPIWELASTGFTTPDDVAVVWARDITPTVELQRAVARAETMGAMGELLAGVAHEVRNPLFAITALLDAWSLKPEIQEGPFLPALRREVTRMRELMEELLEYGRPFNRSLMVGSLDIVAAEAIRILEPNARTRSVTIRSHVFGTVAMDTARMLRVFLNLIQNAIEHSPAGGVIDVGCTTQLNSDVDVVEITVRDRGPGFHDADLPLVFHPFFTRRPGGTGLGLPIVQRILDEHGGTISVGNHPDGSALIRVQLLLAGTTATM